MEPTNPAIVDLRVIHFHAEAVGAAYIAHLQRCGTITFRKAQDVVFDADADQVRITVGGANVIETHPVDLATLGSALLFYCIDTRIPIPRKARRKLTIAADAVVLSLEITYPAAPVRREAQPRGGVAKAMTW